MELRKAEPFIIALFFALLYASTFSHFLNGFTHDEFRLLNVVKGMREYTVPMFLDQNFYLHPPLLLYAIYLVSVFLPIDAAAMSIELVSSFCTVVFTYFIAKKFLGRSGAISASAIVGTHQNVWVMSNRFLFEAPLLMMFALCTYLLLKADDSRNKTVLIFLGIALGGAAMLKISALFMVLIFLLYTLIKKKPVWYRNGRVQVRLAEVLNAAAVVSIAALVFLPYIIYIAINNAPSATDVIFSAMEEGSTTFATPSPWYYYLTSMPNFLNPLLFAFFLLGTAFGVRHRSKVTVLLLWLLLPAVFFSFATFKDTRYINPIFPFCAIVAVYGILKLGLGEKVTMLISILVASFGAWQSLSVVLNDGEWPSNYQAWDYLNSIDSNGVLLAHDYWWAAGFFTDNFVEYITGDMNGDYPLILFCNSHYLLADSDWPYLADSTIFEPVTYLPELDSTLYMINWTGFSGLFQGRTEVRVKLTRSGEPVGGAMVMINDQQIGRVAADGRFSTFLAGDGIFSIEIKKVCYKTETINAGLQSGALYQCESPGILCSPVPELSAEMEETPCVYHPEFTSDRY